jgi:hypothetical protein
MSLPTKRVLTATRGTCRKWHAIAALCKTGNGDAMIESAPSLDEFNAKIVALFGQSLTQPAPEAA